MRFSLPACLLLVPLSLSACSDAPPDLPSTGGAGGSSSGGVAGSGAGGPTGGSPANLSGGTAGTSTGGQAAGGGATAGIGGSVGANTNQLNCSDPVNLPRTYTAVLECIIEAGCQSSICHGGAEPLLLIDTWENFPRQSEHSPYDLLTETLLNHTVSTCANSPLVDPGNPDNSALVKVLARKCDDPSWGMPDGCSETPCIPQEYIDFIAEWIAAGASMQAEAP